MKLLAILGLLLTVLMTSCIDPKAQADAMHTIYFKDKKTGVCFASFYVGEQVKHINRNTLTCAPCDSLKNIEIFEINK